VTETGYNKTTQFNGNRATVKENTYDDRVDSEIITLVADRYIVTLSGSGLSFKELEKVYNELNLNNLK
jgi:serine/threonine-protein kinase RIO1